MMPSAIRSCSPLLPTHVVLSFPLQAHKAKEAVLGRAHHAADVATDQASRQRPRYLVLLPLQLLTFALLRCLLLLWLCRSSAVTFLFCQQCFGGGGC